MTTGPDLRALNHMSDEVKRVHLRLTEWARWARDRPITGWPERTLLARLVEDGVTGASQSGPPPVGASDEISATDAAVRALGEIDRKVIENYYLRWEPTESLARRCRMREREFVNVLRRARWRVLGYVDGYLTQRASL